MSHFPAQAFRDAADALPVEMVQKAIDPSARATLERIAGSTLAAEGKLCVVGLGAIAGRLGARWDIRRDAVYEHVERGLERLLPADAMFLRVSATDYLIAQPSLEKAAAQGFCLRFMRETLRHFLGDANDADIAVMEVKRLDSRSIQASCIDPLSASAFADMPYATITGSAKPAPEPLPPANPWSPFVASDGNELHVSCYMQRMTNLKTQEVIGYRIGRFVVTKAQGRLTPSQLSRMSRSDIERVDKASIYQGLNMLKEANLRPVVLGLPLSFTTLNSLRGRSMLAEAFKTAGQHVTGGLVAGVYDVEGAPPGALLSASSLLRPFCLRIFANLHAPTRADIRRLKGGGLNGIGVHCPPFSGDAEFMGWTRAVVLEASHIGAVVLHGLKSERHAEIAANLGVTHATLWEDDWSAGDSIVADSAPPPNPALRALGMQA